MALETCSLNLLIYVQDANKHRSLQLKEKDIKRLNDEFENKLE